MKCMCSLKIICVLSFESGLGLGHVCVDGLSQRDVRSQHACFHATSFAGFCCMFVRPCLIPA